MEKLICSSLFSYFKKEENPEYSLWVLVSCMGISRTLKINPIFFRVDSQLSQIHVKQFYRRNSIPLTAELPSTNLHIYRGVARIATRLFYCIRKLMSTNMTKFSTLFKIEHLNFLPRQSLGNNYLEQSRINQYQQFRTMFVLFGKLV